MGIASVDSLTQTALRLLGYINFMRFGTEPFVAEALRIVFKDFSKIFAAKIIF